MIFWLLGLLVFAPLTAAAQNASPQNQPAAAEPTAEQLLKPEELDAVVAPIALYPDKLLSLALIASTYPLEVVQADRWLKENKKLKADQLKAKVDEQAWDDSVKSLAATPEVLSLMSSKLDWMVKLGDAVLAQQPDVMDAIQRLRKRADANKKLISTKEQTVSKRQEQGKEIIVIEPTKPDTVYVPYYNPAVVYGGWPSPAYPPYYFATPPYIPGGLIATGLAFGAGFALGRWTSGSYWGSGVNWVNNNININRSGNNWQHNPAHRQGVRYNNGNVQQKFGNANIRNGSQNRMDFRGRSGNQVLNPGGGARPGGAQRPGVGERPGGAQRPSAGQRPSGGRPSAGQRPSGGRPSAGQRPSQGRGQVGQRPSGGARGGGNALGNISSGRVANAQAARGRASLGSAGFGGARSFGGAGGFHRGGGGGFHGGGGRGFHGGGGRGGGGRGGRRSDIRLKHDIVLLGHLSNGLGYYRFSYNGSEKAYVGVMAQEVQAVMPKAVVRDRDGYLRVYYEKLGIEFQTYKQWIAAGARVPDTPATSY
ncbi:MAG: DUF3300 domain-containing protein [Hyphomicrobiales bacterium]|nr:DUF3300 domain-containing protein [Hyphomicrobiales bacterium]